MAGSTRSGALLLGAVALGLSVFGIVAAATDPNPMGLAKDTLVLNGYPPKTANILVTISTGSTATVTLSNDATIDSLTLGANDAGARILARITRRSWETLGLREGMDVWAQVKGVSLAHK